MKGALCLLVLLLVGLVSARSTFSANFELRRPSMTSGGYVSGKFLYSVEQHQLKLDYPDRSYAEIFKYRELYGTGDDREDNNQWSYMIGESCEGQCFAYKIEHVFPRYDKDVSLYQATPGDVIPGCEHHSAISPNSTVREIWFTASGDVCRALWADGTEYRFSNVTAYTFNDGDFAEPDDCRCGQPVDVVVLIDRSASIGRKDYERERSFVRDWSRNFVISPSQANFLIAQFDTNVEIITDFYEGVSDANVDAAINSMQCDCEGTLDASGTKEIWPRLDGGALCCPRKTSLAKAFSEATRFLSNGRPGAKQVVAIITDGRLSANLEGKSCRLPFGIDCIWELMQTVKGLYEAHPNVTLLAIGSGNKYTENLGLIVSNQAAHIGDVEKYWEDKLASRYLVGSVGCPAPSKYCNPDECCGLCQCGECKSPTACEENEDYCQVNDFFGFRCCQTRPRDCSVSGNLCTYGTCNSETASCETINHICPTNNFNPECYERTCDVNSGICSSRPTGLGRDCQEECTTDADCDDANACTIDFCTGPVGSRTCGFAPLQCDDNDICTTDACVGPSTGCVYTPQPAQFCDDDVDCTVDSCVAGVGCRNVDGDCNDGFDCTTDTCNRTLGHCVNEDKSCPVSNDNCTLNFCSGGACTSRSLCEEALVEEGLSGGYIALITIGSALGIAGLGVGAFFAIKIAMASKLAPAGGSAIDFAAD